MRHAQRASFYRIMNFKETVKSFLDQALLENESLFLIDFSVNESNKITIILDGDHGVTLQDCMDISRAVEHQLDSELHDFSLDVFSAGVSTPLKFVRQYIKNVGRNLKITTLQNETFEAKLTNADESKIKIEWQSREPKKIGKGKETVNNEKEIVYDQIKEAIVLISF